VNLELQGQPILQLSSSFKQKHISSSNKAFKSKIGELKMSLRRYLTYGGIAAASLALGVVEGIYDTPCIFKPVLVAAPLVSASVGVSTETRDEYHSYLSVISGMEKGFEHVARVIGGAAKGGGLSAICEAAGFGIGKLLSR
jgi:hypothetical protein